MRSYYVAQQHKSPPKLQDFFDFYDCLLTDILTRYPWHQASLWPSQMPTGEEKLACQTRSGHQSAAAALHQSCSSEHSTSPWDHHPDYPELKEKGSFRTGLKVLDFPALWRPHTKYGSVCCTGSGSSLALICNGNTLVVVSDDLSAPSRLIQVAFVSYHAV